MSRTTTLTIGVAVMAVQISPCWAEEPTFAEYSASELRSLITATQDRVQTLYAEYRSYASSDPATPAGAYFHCIVASKSPCYLYASSGHGDAKLDWREDPFRIENYVTADGWSQWFPMSRVCLRGKHRARSSLPGGLNEEFYLFASGLWPPHTYAAPRVGGRPHMLRDVAACEDYSKVRSRQELVQGRWCHVLEDDGRDTLWLDVERGCALMAREKRVAKQGSLVFRLELGRHMEASAGIWLPTRIRNEQYDFTASDLQKRQRAVTDSEIVVESLRVSDVDDTFFRHPDPPGAAEEVAPPKPVVQFNPGGLDHLESTAAWLRKYCWQEPTKSSLSSYWMVIASFGGIAICEVAYQLHRRRRKRPVALRAEAPAATPPKGAGELSNVRMM